VIFFANTHNELGYICLLYGKRRLFG